MTPREARDMKYIVAICVAAVVIFLLYISFNN
jgi:hypothetical protein